MQACPSPAVHTASDGEEELLVVLSKPCLAILPSGQACCLSLACTSIPAASGNHPVHLPQLYKATAAFTGMTRVICSA